MFGLSSIRAINHRAAEVYREREAAKTQRSEQQSRRDAAGGVAVRSRPIGAAAPARDPYLPTPVRAPEINGRPVRVGRFVSGND